VAFFSQPLPGPPGLALFLNAGDPPLDVFRELVLMLDAAKVDCLELAIPFPNSASDGPVIRESASRALAVGVDADAVLGFIAGVRPGLTHLKIALLADWSYSIKRTPLPEFLARVKQAGADGLLVVTRADLADPGKATEEALARTLATTGRAIAFSGLTVAVGLSSMACRRGCGPSTTTRRARSASRSLPRATPPPSRPCSTRRPSTGRPTSTWSRRTGAAAPSDRQTTPPSSR